MIGVNIEDLTEWIPKFIPYKILIVRLYPDGVEPREPYPFRFAVVAIVRRGIAEIKALCGGVTTPYRRALEKSLAAIGVKEMEWRHDGVNHRLPTGR